MKNEIYILFTAGRGPMECRLAVQGIQNKFKKHLDSEKVTYEVVSQKKGQLSKSIETIVFKVFTTEKDIVELWIGTILWICKNPIRRFNKRKNWYIKCQKISFPKQMETNIKDVVVQAYKASGPGGQHRNKVETAIRITHVPTGVMVTASDGKSQAQNKKKAYQKLETKLKTRNDDILKGYNLEQWTNQIQIERGNPSKIFRGPKFLEN